jgi:hypothetical protein
MIFMTGKEGGNIMLLLSEKDIQSMREGRTLFVDERQTQGLLFKSVTLGLSPTDQHSLELIRQSGKRVAQLPNPEPGPQEVRCSTCPAILSVGQLFEERCMVCWATEAKERRGKPTVEEAEGIA